MSPSPFRRLGAGAVVAACMSAALCSGVTAPTLAFAAENPRDTTATAPSTDQPQSGAQPTDQSAQNSANADSSTAADQPNAPNSGSATTADPSQGSGTGATQNPAGTNSQQGPDTAATGSGTDATDSTNSTGSTDTSAVETEKPITGESGNAAEHWPLAITEINGDNPGKDLYEYVEVTNTTSQPIDLDSAGVQLRYHTSQWNEGTVQPLIHLDGEADSPTVIPAGGVAVFWMNYGEGDERRALSKDQFREFYGIDGSVPIFRFGPQGGFANGGDRGLSLTDKEGKTLSRAWVPKDDGDSSTPWNAQFAVPNEIGSADARLIEFDTTGAAAKPTPGTITVEQVTSTLTKPAEPTDPTEPTDPVDPTDPETAVGPGASGNAAEHWPLVITEINGDNPGDDFYEYVEITNTTKKPIDLDAAGYQIRYHTSQWNEGSAQPLIHLDGEADAPAVIPAGGVAVFWMNYEAGNSRRGIAKDEFRKFYGIDASVPVFRFGPQKGFANGGDRGFSITDQTGNTLSRAWVPADDGTSTPWNAQFSVPNTIGSVDARLTEYDTTGKTANPTPGAIKVEQVTSALTKPTDPSLNSPVLQITEVAPDTANVGGADAFEFIEIYNASNAPVNFGDYVLNYLTTDNDLKQPTTNSSTLWPAGPGEPVIQPGKTLVLWIQNPSVIAAGYDAARFNQEFGTNLVLGENLLTIKSNGMANGGSRGLQLQTKSGYDVSRAYYFTDDQTTASTAIQYAWNPGDVSPMWAPADATGAIQTMLGIETPTPGSVSKKQVSASLMQFPAQGSAPEITNLTKESDTPGAEDLGLAFNITDDSLVRRVTLRVTDDTKRDETRDLSFSDLDTYRFTVPKVDLYGKKWIEYTVTASDGHQTSTLGPIRIALSDKDLDPVRLNVTDQQFVNGQTPLVATAQDGPEGLSLGIDGTPVTDGTSSLEAAPKFAIEATDTDAFFRNGIKLGDNVLKIFDEGFYEKIVTVDADVPVNEVVPGQTVTIGVYSGTKAWPKLDLNENNDDFSFMNPRLSLPDGRVLLPSACSGEGEVQPLRDLKCPATSTERVSLSDDNLVYFLATFTIPDDAFNSVSKTWDTTQVSDGEHLVTASRGDLEVRRTVIVDNTAPVIESTIEDGQSYRGEFTIDASASDAGSGQDKLSATLDGKAVSLPYDTSSLKIQPGEHSFVVTAQDKIGNISTRTIAFTTPDEQPTTTLTSPADGAVVSGDKVKLEAIPVSNASEQLAAARKSGDADRLEACFVEGFSFNPESSQVVASSGTTKNASSTDRSSAKPMSADDLAKLGGTDGIAVEETSATELPYQLFTVDVPEGAEKGADTRVQWAGSANADAKVLLYVQTEKGKWEEVDRYVTTGGAPTTFTLEAQVPVSGHVKDDKLVFLVQHSEGWAGADLSSRDSAVTPFNAAATPRSAYDFTVAWESDTQYYNKNEGLRAGTGGSDTWYQHQLNIHDFVLKQRENLNIQYMMHTGDIVDSYDQDFQWENADAAYAKLDVAGLPYGVLAGNHDVGHFEGDYTNYSANFGEQRFGSNPWYGGSYKDNRGHYDLVSAGGIDLLMLYMGWPDPNNEASNSRDIAWMNSVIQQYPERKVIVNLHEFMLTTGGLGPMPQRIQDEVVAPNPNVIAVASGHYHDAYTRQDHFDDNGDGTPDRTVYSMLFDYQGLAEGGQGFLRLLHFDNQNGKIVVRTYSPSLDTFDSDEPSLNSPAGMQEFEIPYAAAGITPAAKTLATDSFTADILTAKTIGCAKNVQSGDTASVTWEKLKPGQHSWFVKTTGPFGGVAYSEVRTFTVSEDANTGGGSEGSNTGGGETGTGANTGGGSENTGGGSESAGGAGLTGSDSGSSSGVANTGGTLAWPAIAGALLAAGTGLIALFTAKRRQRRTGDSARVK